MEHYITWGELAGLLAVLWLPIFLVAAVLHWQLLSGRRWRALCVVAAFFVGVALALLVWFSPIHRMFVYLGQLGPFFSMGGIPLQAALLSTLLVTLIILVLRRIGLPPNNSFKGMRNLIRFS